MRVCVLRYMIGHFNMTQKRKNYQQVEAAGPSWCFYIQTVGLSWAYAWLVVAQGIGYHFSPGQKNRLYPAALLKSKIRHNNSLVEISTDLGANFCRFCQIQVLRPIWHLLSNVQCKQTADNLHYCICLLCCISVRYIVYTLLKLLHKCNLIQTDRLHQLMMPQPDLNL